MRHLANFHVAARALRRNLSFTTVAVIILALGIGASTAVFTVLKSVLLDPLGYLDPERLVQVRLSQPEHPDPSLRLRAYLSPPFVAALRARTEVFAGLGAMNTYRELGADFTDGSRPERVRVLPVALDYFQTLGIAPQFGRVLQPGETDPRVAVVSHGFWEQSLGGVAAALERPITLDGVSYRVVGVMPAGFPHLMGHETDVWRPEFDGPPPSTRNDWGNHYLEVVGRLTPGVTLAQAQSRLDTYTRALSREIGLRSALAVRLTPLQEATVGRARQSLWILMGSAALLLVSACVNVANLFLARGIGRARELAVRVALGAGRMGLLRHLLAESLLLTGVAAGAGFGLAYGAVRALTALRPEGLPRPGEVGLDGTVLGLAMAVAVGAGFAFAVLPGIAFLRASPGVALREGSTRTTANPRRRQLQSWLVTSQVAAALILLAGAGVLVKSFRQLQRVDLGFEPRGAWTYDVNLPSARYRTAESRLAFHAALQDRIRALPQVAGSGAVDWLPVQGRYHPWGFVRLDVSDPERMMADARVVDGDYFAVARIPLVQGRSFTTADRADVEKVAVVSRTVAEEYYRDGTPIGKHIVLLGREWTIVGIVGDVSADAQGTIVPLVYLPHTQFADNRNWALHQVVTWRGNPADGPARIRSEVAAIDPDLVVVQGRPLGDVAATALARERFTLLLMGVFGGAALLLAAVGLYGVLAFLVREQRHDIGIRLALGAPARHLRMLVLRRALRMVVFGIAAGLVAAPVLGRWLRALVFGIPVTDPWVLGAVVGGLLAVTWAASWVPMRRALGMDPAGVLRDE